MRNFMRKLTRTVSDAQPSNWASLCLNSCLFSFCSNDGPQIRSMRLFLNAATSAFTVRALCDDGELLALAFDGIPSCVCSGPLLLLLLAAASTTAALLLLPAVTLHRLHRAVTKLDDALPHGLQHHCESKSSTPTCNQSNRASHSANAPTAASRSPMHTALARSPEPAPAGGRARCWPRPPTAGQLSGRARRAERLPAAQRRPKKKMGLVGHRENQIRHGGRHQSVLRGKPFL